jgi:hypothetical protein
LLIPSSHEDAQSVVHAVLQGKESEEAARWLNENRLAALTVCNQWLILVGYEEMKAREAKGATPGNPRFQEAADRVIQPYEAWGKKTRQPSGEPSCSGRLNEARDTQCSTLIIQIRRIQRTCSLRVAGFAAAELRERRRRGSISKSLLAYAS